MNNAGRKNKIITTIEEIFILCGIIFLLNNYAYTNLDFINVLLYARLIYLAFTEPSYLNNLCENPIILFCGRLSVSIFVAHDVIARTFGLYYQRFVHPYWVYLFLCIVISLLNYGCAQIIKKGVKKVLS